MPEDIKKCPLRDDKFCLRENCQWYIQRDRGVFQEPACAIPAMAQALMHISTRMPSR